MSNADHHHHHHQQQQEQQPENSVGGRHVCQNLHFSQEYLSKCEIETNLECAVKNCGAFFSNRSALNLHLDKVHRIQLKNDSKSNEYTLTRSMSKKTKETKNCRCEYFCPVDSCKYGCSPNGKKSLPTFHSLKVHFIRIHGDKKYVCPRCQKSFSIKSELERHDKSCGHLIRCDECQVDFSTHQSYRKHCLKKGHKIDEPKTQTPALTEKTSCTKSLAKKRPEPVQRLTSSSSSISSSSYPQTYPTLNTMKQIQAPLQLSMIQSINHQIPIIIIPFSGTTTAANTTITATTINQNNSNNHRILLPSSQSEAGTETISVMLLDNDHQQRSLGCQTSINTQETGSQTRNITTTGENISTYASTCQTISSELNVDYLQDAATSTSPLLDDIELFLNDISTQTINPQGLDQPLRSISIQTTSENEQQNMSEDKYELIGSSATSTATATSTAFSNHLKEASSSCLVANDSIVLMKKPTTSTSSFAEPSRCLTPVNMCNAPSQTEDFYFHSNMMNLTGNTHSTHTQTSNYNHMGAQTQTEFDFD